ncbi:helicase-exonuclease AddAB subunit AddA [Pseudoflavonifractor sp. MSJ-37]|uniref:helicase-exonuclease AddAB subunit AddA n=1 Tax=Pseudoflavonifractor sp. MSJ-37 TaxID=2841531 RepID=UPI001C1162E5|nr:helicase-exonuclease AddAB subunit AddA [Pseudoflavonifractor sp. MSJ-37]MBU5434588.1 helicase-exonuclease AddAB subunit AddA [Pseudoflavonifractor sp. MSJ-37]
MGFALTEQQQAVVDDRGGTLLVSAAAGSGKTRVLVERLLDRVEREGLDVDRFLVITYTKAAAAELRSRIVEELADRLAAHPEDGHLRRQSTLVYKAQISTVHAFCAQLLREQGYLLDLDPDFRLLDESEAGLLMLDSLTDLLEQRYDGLEAEDPFARLVDTMSAGRDDSRLIQIVLDIRGRVQSHPHPDRWLDQQAAAFDLTGAAEAGETVWGRLLLEDAACQARYWAGQMAKALELCECDDVFQGNYAPSLSATLDGLLRFASAAEKGWDAARAQLPIPFPTPGRKKVPAGLGDTELVKDLRKRCKARMDKLAEGFADDSADLLEDLREVRPTVGALFTLVRDFEAAYAAEKKRRGALDFSDLEHRAVELLVRPEGGPTELAEQIARRYDEIMVDEYQDTNEVQNAIFSAISRKGTNLFLVGDVKQSIYRFRLADPTIFLEKYRTFPSYEREREGEPRRISLSRNFRSREEVLEGANFLFRNLMSTEFGEMDYGPEEALYPGGVFPGGEDTAVELDALDLSGDDLEEEDRPREERAAKPGKDLLEARFAARRIRELLDGGFRIRSGDAVRPAAPSDVVILLRSPGTVLHHYARALGEQNIPWEAEGGGDFFASTEVSVALALLQIVDNPRKDVPLISALRSPVYGFSADRLAQLRAGCPEGDIFQTVRAGAERGEEDCAAFLSELEDLRFGAADLSCYQLLWQIYDRSDLMGVFGSLSNGEERQASLLLLAELARRFESAGHKGLYGFLSYLERLREKGERIAAPDPGREGGGVRVLSIHRSKGLEFPIVLLCGLSRRLNREDMQRPILFHPKLGVGPKRLDLGRMIEYPTLARRAVARQLDREMMAEELRLLYVAVTRAKDKLILSVALTGGGKDIAKLAPDAACPAEPQALAACSSVGQWVLLPVLCRPEAAPLRDAGAVDVPLPVCPMGPKWDIRWVPGGPLTKAAGRIGMGVSTPDAAPADPDPDLLARLTWTYPQAADVELPSKLTATQLKGRELDREAAEGAGPDRDAPAADRLRPIRRPRFAEEEFGLTAAQKGTALHLVMQYIDFDKTASPAQVGREIQRLVREQFLTPEQGEAVAPERIAAFFASPLGKAVRSAPSLRREFKFSILVPAADFWPQAGEGERVLLQGVVDCFFDGPEGLTVVDFKTDRVKGDALLRRAEEYRPQLAAYGRALEEICGRPAARRVLWFFSEDRAVEV